MPSLDFKVERRFSGDNERNILTVSNPWIGWGGLDSSTTEPKYTEELFYSTRLVDEEGNDTISIDLNGIMYSRPHSEEDWIWKGVNIGDTAIVVRIMNTDDGGTPTITVEDRLYFNQESRVLYYHTPTTTYAIGVLIQTILTTDNVEVLFKIFDATKNIPRALKVVKGQAIQTLLPSTYTHINSNSGININSYWSYLNEVDKTRDLPTLHFKLSLKTEDEHVVSILVPNYEEKYKILNATYLPYQTADSFLCWRAVPIPPQGESLSGNTGDLIYNPDSQSPGNCIISGVYYPFNRRLRPSILLGLNDSTPKPNPGSILNIRRGEHSISTKLEGLIEEYTIYSSAYKSIIGELIPRFISTYKIYLPDSLYVDKRDVEYKKPLVKLNSTQPSTTTDDNTSDSDNTGEDGTTGGSGGTTGGTGGTTGGDNSGDSEFNPNPPSSGVSSGVSTSTDDELNQDNL